MIKRYLKFLTNWKYQTSMMFNDKQTNIQIYFIDFLWRSVKLLYLNRSKSVTHIFAYHHSVEILWNGVNERLTPTESECQFIDLKTNLRQQSGIWSRKYSWVFNFSFHFLFTFTSLNRRMEYKIRHPRFAKIKIIASRYVKYTTANEKRKK